MIRRLTVSILLIWLVQSACARAEDTPPATDLHRLLATLDAEPLAAAAVEDVRALPEQLGKTKLLAMLQDPSYAEGARAIGVLLSDALGADFRMLWPDVSRNLRGPAALAVLPPKDDGNPLRLVLAVLAPDADAAARLRELWPRVPPQANALLSVVRLQPVAASDLPPPEKLPAWALPEEWPQALVALRVLPQKTAAAVRKIYGNAEDPAAAALAPVHVPKWLGWVTEVGGDDVAVLRAGFGVSGEIFVEDLQLELVPERQSAFTRVAKTIRESPGQTPPSAQKPENRWDGLTAALPGETDIVVLGQADLKALGEDLPRAAQALERYLRGRRWTRSKAHLPEVLAPERFTFISERLQGAFGIAGYPSISGEMRVTLAAAVKDGEVEKLRESLIDGLKEVGADFATLEKARKIGGAPPLAARFQGRGLFGAPVIGLSPGWLWLCSNSGSYADLTTAFRDKTTLKAALDRERGTTVQAVKTGKLPVPQSAGWGPADALRVQINLERVTKLLYGWWLVSGDNMLGNWQVPAELLPQPALFNGRMGMLRAGASRQGLTLTSSAASTVPGASLLLVSLLQSSALQIRESERIAAEAKDAVETPSVSPPFEGGENKSTPSVSPPSEGGEKKSAPTESPPEGVEKVTR